MTTDAKLALCWLSPTKQPAQPRPALSLVPKDRGTEQFPYGRQAVGRKAVPFTVGR